MGAALSDTIGGRTQFGGRPYLYFRYGSESRIVWHRNAKGLLLSFVLCVVGGTVIHMTSLQAERVPLDSERTQVNASHWVIHSQEAQRIKADGLLLKYTLQGGAGLIMFSIGLFMHLWLLKDPIHCPESKSEDL